MATGNRNGPLVPTLGTPDDPAVLQMERVKAYLLAEWPEQLSEKNVVVVAFDQRIEQLAGGLYITIYDASGTTYGEDQDEGGNAIGNWQMGISVRDLHVSDAPKTITEANKKIRQSARAIRNLIHLKADATSPRRWDVEPHILRQDKPIPSYGNEGAPVELVIAQTYAMYTFETYDMYKATPP